MSELMTVNDNQVAVQGDAGQVMATRILELAADPNFDVDKLERLIELQTKETERQATVAFSTAFAAMQSEIPTIAKAKSGNGSNYATLEDVVEITRPILNKYGFSLSFDTNTVLEKNEDKSANDYKGYVEITAILLHKHGHKEKTTLLVPFDYSGSKKNNPAQAMGSSVSYGKRYTLCALLNIATRDDNDASAAWQHKKITAAQERGLTAKRDKLSDSGIESFNKWLLNDFAVDAIADIPQSAYNYIDGQLTNKLNAAKELETA